MLVIRFVVAGLFGVAGMAKVIGAKPLADQFREFGLPSWSMRAVGLLEVAGAAGLFIDATRFWAAAGLVVLMLGAVANHAKVRHPLSKSAPALVLLVLSVLLAASSWGPEVWRPW